MTEWFGKIIDFIKLPIKYIWVAVIFTGFFIFAPLNWFEKLNLVNFKTNHISWIGPAFLLSSAIVILDILISFSSFIKKKIRTRKLRNELKELILRLDPYEKSILREFYIQNKKTLQLPIDQATVSGMLQNNLLLLAGNQGERSLAGSLFPVRINPTILKYLTFQHIELPVDPSDKDFEWLKKNRPEFLYEIDEHNKLFHNHWSKRWW